jgi:hypothetical protein
VYSKQEISKQKQVFWTTFGKYMQPVLSADGEEINWVNYKTGISGITFKMDVDNRQATIQIRLSQVDTTLQKKHYNQFLQLKSMLQSELNEEWQWQPMTANEVSTIGTQLSGLSIHRSEDWPAIISFLKPRIVALDAFWSNAKYAFESIM